MNNLEESFDNIIPQNLKENESIYKLIKLYLSSFSDHETIISNPIELLDTDFLIEKYINTGDERYDNIRKENFKINLEEIYNILDGVSSSEEIYYKFKKVYETLNLPTNNLKVIADIDASINSQYLNASQSFKTKKGTKSGFFFIYDIIDKSGIQSINSDKYFKILEDDITPYKYTIQTSLYKEVFKETIIPLSHPVGFEWSFIRVLYLTAEDYFGVEENKELKETTLTCYENGLELNTTEIVNSKIYGELKSFNISENADRDKLITIDYYPLDGTDYNGIRVVKDYNGSIIIYDRQLEKYNPSLDETEYLDITDVRIVESENGILDINYINRTYNNNTYKVIDSISFKEYTLINKEYFTIEYKILGDLDIWNSVKLPLNNKVVSSEVRFYEPKIFTREDILTIDESYNGRIIVNKGDTCSITYDIEYSYSVITKDSSSIEYNQDIEDSFPEILSDKVIGDEWEIGGTFFDYETNVLRDIHIGFGLLYNDSAEIVEEILATPLVSYSYSSLLDNLIINEPENGGFIISDEVFIGGEGITIEARADVYREIWNDDESNMTTEDNVIYSTYETYGMKVYRLDSNGDWLYLEDNNIDAISI